MPELAELKLTADFVNEKSRGRLFTGVSKNPVHKLPQPEMPFGSFIITSKARGKEMVVYIESTETDETWPIRFTMGMSGHFEHHVSNQAPKHAHLSFHANDGTSLSFVDVRRFGRWLPGKEWSQDRGPCPLTEHRQFVNHVIHNLEHRDFNKPIHVALMNQKWFNGIGNYLRAEILYRVDVNPFMEARLAIIEHPEILELCGDVTRQAYQLGGGQLYSWNNPNGTQDPQSWQDFMQCYGNETMHKIKDINGRTFWYDPVWKDLNLDQDWDYYSDLPNPNAYK